MHLVSFLGACLWDACFVSLFGVDGSRPEEVEDVCSKMLGHKLITKQTGSEGKPCQKVLLSVYDCK